jgi:chemotaxis protein histidine kinase CheA
MKLSPTNQIVISVSAGVVSLCAGALLTSNFKNAGQTITLATLLSLPTVAGLHLVLDGKATKRINEAQTKASNAESRASQAEFKAVEATATLSQTQSRLADLGKKNSELAIELASIQKTLEDVNLHREQLLVYAENTQPTINQLQEELKTAQQTVEALQAEIEELETDFEEKVESEAQQRLQEAKKEEIQRIFDEHDAITSQAMSLFKRLQSWGQKVAVSHEQKRELIITLAGAYNQNLEGVRELVEKEHGHYIQQIEILHENVARLQQRLAGDLVEPSYGQFGFDPNGKIANALAEWLWNHHKIPLKVTGFEISSDGVLTAGYIYSRSMAPESLARLIEDDSSQIARSLGLYSVEKPQKLQIADVFTVKVRRERPARKADKGSLYRSKEEFINYILSQPVRMRIVGEPGAGKTPTVAVLLSHVLKRGFLEANTPNGRKLPYSIVESCNPLAGISVKNGDELDFCLRWNSGARGFKGLLEEYRFRKNPTNADYKNSVGYIWVADEIDNTMAELTKDEAKPFKDALKDGGHVNLGVIVMGQSANVSTSKGLSIDDQKMLTNIYIDPVSIRTFLTQYGERFYSKRAVEKALATLEELELEIEERNEVICDTAREFRIGMVTASRSPIFYQLPYFDSVEIDLNEYQQTLAKVALIREGRGKTGVVSRVSDDFEDVSTATLSERLDGSRHSPYVGLETGRDVSGKPACPYCKSEKVRSKGDSWLCQNPEHSSVAPNKPKSWKK